MEDLTKEVISFRLRLANIIKLEIPGVEVPGKKDEYSEDVLIIKSPKHKHIESVFKIFLRIRSFLWIDSAELVKYIDSSVPAIERAVAKVILAEGNKKIRRLLPLYVKLLPWYQAKEARKYEKMDEDKAAAQLKAGVRIEEKFKREVRRLVLDKYVVKGLPIPELWKNDDVYSAPMLVENYQRFGKDYDDVYPN
jgi:hypothetical protein